MKLLLRTLFALAALALIACTAAYAETSQGRVIVVQDKTLFIRTESGEPLSFNPKFINNGREWVVAKPANTVLPALESGEVVNITWSWDTAEGRRRIDDISIISPAQGVTRGTVVSANATTLVISPKDEPGTVTLNNTYAQVDRKWVPNPQISRILVGLKPKMKVVVGWYWDNEGRKRISRVELDTK